ncbi:hypothetical protein [Streptomyces sp. JHA26]|uniref:hypothetical protein n=1 Tax=Streptomyces sp. JHA26 TaxID=1917143 RepID=UPI00098ABE23|nr:hypothetical protein [Streptomyces sp. JHA26]
MRHKGRARAVAAAMTAVVVVGPTSGCSSHDTAQDDETREHYCSALGTWQRTKARSENADVAGYAALAAARRLDREGLDRSGSHVLQDTALAVDTADTAAEGRVASYCTDAGFETYVR